MPQRSSGAHVILSIHICYGSSAAAMRGIGCTCMYAGVLLTLCPFREHTAHILDNSRTFQCPSLLSYLGGGGGAVRPLRVSQRCTAMSYLAVCENPTKMLCPFLCILITRQPGLLYEVNGTKPRPHTNL